MRRPDPSDSGRARGLGIGRQGATDFMKNASGGQEATEVVFHVGRFGGREPPEPPGEKGRQGHPKDPRFVGRRRRVLGRSVVAELTRYRKPRSAIGSTEGGPTDCMWGVSEAGSLRSRLHVASLGSA